MILKRSWVEISLPILQKNLKIYDGLIQSNSKIMAVIKADAYGHGATRIAETLQNSGVNDFAVSNVLEAIELRKIGIKGQILVLGYTPIENLNLVEEYDITQALLSSEYTENVISSGFKIKCQYAIDTGMNRIGLDAEDIISTKIAIERASEYLVLTGLFTHLCVADTDSEYNFTINQQKIFSKIVQQVQNLNLPYIHSLNSAGGLWYHDNISNLNRLGIIMYGLKPDYLNSLPDGISPILEWKTRIAMIKNVLAGETIGYGRSYLVKRNSIIATIPTGYADGYNRALSNIGYVLIRGKKAPIVGKICMDQFMVDVTDIPEAETYDEVILIGKSGKEILTADDMAHMIGTIGYEIVCNIGKRVPRIYLS